MAIDKTLRPGDMGTKRFLNEYGDKLVCVRYHVDKQQQKRYITVELIIDEKPYIQVAQPDHFYAVSLRYTLYKGPVSTALEPHKIKEQLLPIFPGQKS